MLFFHPAIFIQVTGFVKIFRLLSLRCKSLLLKIIAFCVIEFFHAKLGPMLFKKCDIKFAVECVFARMNSINPIFSNSLTISSNDSGINFQL
jgi:hypothetical protein